MAAKNTKNDGPVIIRKYANRRLYNTASSSYVTLDHLAEMVRDDVDFVVHDAKSGEDITRSVLTQIIVEQEAKGENLLPISFLRQLISLYGDSLSSLVPSYLDVSMQSFSKNEERMRQMMQNTFDGLFPMNQFEEVGRQNAAFYEQALKMFNPFAESQAEGTEEQPEKAEAPKGEKDIADLENRLNAMQSQLEALLKTKNEG